MKEYFRYCGVEREENSVWKNIDKKLSDNRVLSSKYVEELTG
jgi:hypothetical protein